jgi:hypothetical protein
MLKSRSMLIIVLLAILINPAASEITDRVALDLSFNIKLHMEAVRFIPNEHKIKYCKPAFPTDDWKGVCLIDGKPVFGTDWEMPKYVLKEAIIEINGKRVPLDVSCMYNPWFGMPDSKSFSVEKIEGGFVLEGIFSDGAGAYKAQWQIIDGASVRTKLSQEEC